MKKKFTDQGQCEPVSKGSTDFDAKSSTDNHLEVLDKIRLAQFVGQVTLSAPNRDCVSRGLAAWKSFDTSSDERKVFGKSQLENPLGCFFGTDVV